MKPRDPNPQLDLAFGSPNPRGEGYTRWHQERRDALEDMARKIGLPLGHHAEVVLRDGTVLRGALSLATDELWVDPRRDLRLTLRVDRCTFEARDVESCVRLD